MELASRLLCMACLTEHEGTVTHALLVLQGPAPGHVQPVPVTPTAAATNAFPPPPPGRGAPPALALPGTGGRPAVDGYGCELAPVGVEPSLLMSWSTAPLIGGAVGMSIAHDLALRMGALV
jgi:hypothetical protein